MAKWKSPHEKYGKNQGLPPKKELGTPVAPNNSYWAPVYKPKVDHAALNAWKKEAREDVLNHAVEDDDGGISYSYKNSDRYKDECAPAFITLESAAVMQTYLMGGSFTSAHIVLASGKDLLKFIEDIERDTHEHNALVFKNYEGPKNPASKYFKEVTPAEISKHYAVALFEVRRRNLAIPSYLYWPKRTWLEVVI